MKVVNVTTGRRYDFPDYATMLRLWSCFGKRLWRSEVVVVGDAWLVSWPG